MDDQNNPIVPAHDNTLSAPADIVPQIPKDEVEVVPGDSTFIPTTPPVPTPTPTDQNTNQTNSTLPQTNSTEEAVWPEVKPKSKMPQVLGGIAAIVLVVGVATAAYFVSNKLARTAGVTPNAPESEPMAAEVVTKASTNTKSSTGLGTKTSAGGSVTGSAGGTKTTTTSSGTGGTGLGTKTSAGGSGGTSGSTSLGQSVKNVVNDVVNVISGAAGGATNTKNTGGTLGGSSGTVGGKNTNVRNPGHVVVVSTSTLTGDNTCDAVCAGDPTDEACRGCRRNPPQSTTVTTYSNGTTGTVAVNSQGQTITSLIDSNHVTCSITVDGQETYNNSSVVGVGDCGAANSTTSSGGSGGSGGTGGGGGGSNPTPTVTPTPTGTFAACMEMYIYLKKADGTYGTTPMTATELSKLKIGDKLKFSVKSNKNNLKSRYRVYINNTAQGDWLPGGTPDGLYSSYSDYEIKSAGTYKFEGRVSVATTTISSAGQFCGGIAGIACPSGFRCVYPGGIRNSTPDAGGTCQAG